MAYCSILMQMRCLVTGAAGFIGSHLSERLVKKGYQVIGIDNFKSGIRENFKSLENNLNFNFIECDVRNLNNLKKIDLTYDYVFHLAALADIVPSIEEPNEYIDVNVLGTTNILEYTKGPKLKKFLYAASSSCYGIPDNYPTVEDSEIRPLYPYALSKYLGEQVVLAWSSFYQVPVISLRLFNVYGPRARTSGNYGAVFGVFLAQKLNGKPLTIVGDGEQTRDFTYIEDVVEAFITAAESSYKAEIYNVGSGKTYSINYLADLIGGQKVKLPKRPAEPDVTFASIEKITKELGWKPKTEFEQGVAILLSNIEYWKNAPIWDVKSIRSATANWFKYLSNYNNRGKFEE